MEVMPHMDLVKFWLSRWNESWVVFPVDWWSQCPGDRPLPYVGGWACHGVQYDWVLSKTVNCSSG